MSIIEKLQHKYALSNQGAKDMIKAFVACTLANMAQMMPVGMLYMMTADLLNKELPQNHKTIYIAGSAICIVLIAITEYFQYNATFFSTYVESGVRRRSLAEKLRKIPLSFFGKKDLADLTNTIMSDCAMLETASSHWLPELVGAFISTTLVVISLFFFNVKMAIAAIWVLPVAFIIVFTSRNVMHAVNKKASKYRVACLDGIQEALETVRDLKAYNAQDEYMTGLNKKIKAVESNSIFIEFLNAAFVCNAQMILKFGIGTVALVGSDLLIKNQINVITFFMYLMVVSRMYEPLQIALQNFSALISTDTQCERMDEILSHPEQKGTQKLSNKGYDIEFKNVAFSYEEGDSVLSDVNFVAKQGEVTALIGPSGSGKTTVSRLASRFWDVNKGSIKVGGMDISKIDPEKLLSMYSIVFQDVTLFNNTLLENIRIGRKEATDEEVKIAARLAHCEEFINKLPKGYDTLIGENGSELSGGERQRISIARAFLKDAPIILMDEATASLDVDNESLIQEAISKLIQDKTVLIIAHRMRTVAGADKIVVLKDGIVAEADSPEKLRKSGGIYSHMISLQMKSDNWKMA
ncbi:ATP-binding cassette, subfamily B [Acetitomaculum ruminis DSM 5522]|uniref:ATP-binding cassette, subfamily B n=1 Tax=Acetitomaculum ruminis DSM 5522 TaxID=1120918 RepID=A0A1I0XIF8_9FIRM|nr:ABC transporter ATP-binding protein [Acetitomaculum ruminis]SFB00206.1 ATP-binding cassette, subfamily B [Acetitomaculum ruminis DSM 5522]